MFVSKAFFLNNKWKYLFKDVSQLDNQSVNNYGYTHGSAFQCRGVVTLCILKGASELKNLLYSSSTYGIVDVFLMLKRNRKEKKYTSGIWISQNHMENCEQQTQFITLFIENWQHVRCMYYCTWNFFFNASVCVSVYKMLFLCCMNIRNEF
jgi:hypothetical protein